MEKKLSVLLAAAILALSVCPSCGKTDRLTDYVNPFVGTDYHGHTFPGATAPFGMVQLSPDTRLDTWDGCSGYHYSDSVILGFSHTHLSGTGVLDYGDVLVMPVSSYPADTLDRELYSSPFSHGKESASPGYYSVSLDRPGVFAELTAGERIGMHRYTFMGGGDLQALIIDLEHRDLRLNSSIVEEGPSSISGMRRSKSWSEDHPVYFYMEFSREMKDYVPFGDKGAIVCFDPSQGDELVVKVGISSVSVKNARENLYSESPEGDFDFDALKDRTESRWEEFLSGIDVTEGERDKEKLTTFYTALYHCAIAPNLYSDANGEYRGMDRQVHRADGYDRYTVFSLWDTFRTLHPLFTVMEQERTEDFLRSFLSIYREGGKLPVWELSGWETDCMIGYNSVSVIADAVIKGIGEEYAEELLEAMAVSSEKEEYGIPYYRKQYVVPADKEHESVSKTLEYAYDDWCIATVAGWLYSKTGEKRYADIRDRYMMYSASYRNVFDPSTCLMRPVAGGIWHYPFDPREVNNHYTEANSWQYSFFVPHDINGLIELHGGDDAFCAKLDSLFDASEETTGRTQSDITGLIGQYAHGNEPSHQTAYLYAYAGQPWKTYGRVRQILSELYSPEPDGLCGNDDCGQMSAWYVMSAIGIYPVTPGSGVYVLTSPLFRNVRIRTGNGNVFVVKSEAKGRLDRNPYIMSASLNGEDHACSYIRHEDLMGGGEIVLELGDAPSGFGTAKEDRPIAFGQRDFIRNPWFGNVSDIFEKETEVEICSPDPESRVYCSLDGGPYRLYERPFVIDRTTVARIYAEGKDGRRSPVVETVFHKLKDDMDIELYCEYNPQYNARGDRGLTDGLRGSENWKTGGWQGYQDTDFEAVVDLRSIKGISRIGSGYCQDVRSWIWMPVYVEYSVSSDGKSFVPVGKVESTVDAKDYRVRTMDYVLEIPDGPVQARYVKVFAKNFGTIPSWHLGAGGEGFIFIDEIWVE